MFKRYWWMFLVMVRLGSIAGLLVAAVITYIMPKKVDPLDRAMIYRRRVGSLADPKVFPVNFKSCYFA